MNTDPQPAANASEMETPRTDAAVIPTPNQWLVHASFARTLERELAEARERLIELEGDLIQKLGENKAQAEEIERLRGVIRSIPNHTTEMGGSFTQWHKEICDICHEALAAQNPAGDGE